MQLPSFQLPSFRSAPWRDSGERVGHSGEKVEDDLFHMFGYLRRTLADSSFQNRRLASAERAEVQERQIPVSRFQLAPPRSVHQGTQQIPDSRFQNRSSGLLWAGDRESRFQIPGSTGPSSGGAQKVKRAGVLYFTDSRGGALSGANEEQIPDCRFQAESRKNHHSIYRAVKR